jgi:hypothetical protein
MLGRVRCPGYPGNGSQHVIGRTDTVVALARGGLT